MEIYTKLKEARTRAGLIQEEAAERISVSRQTISNWENGKSLPDIVSVMKMSDLYQVSLDELLKGDQKMQEKLEKDVKNQKGNRRLLIMLSVMVLVVAIINFISMIVGGPFREFCDAALIWVLMGIGLAGALTYLGQKESE